jgi:parallel beta-helix repeat protein
MIGATVRNGMIRRSAIALAAFAVCLALPAGASATHVQCGDVITTNTTFDEDVFCTGPTDGLIIGASRITLDLGGFDLVGDNGSTGILVDGRQAVTIKNGGVTQFQLGVSLFDASRGIVDSLDLSQMNVGIVVEDSNAVELRLNSLSAAGGINLQNANRTFVFDNSVGNGVGSGYFIEGSGNKLIDNAAIANNGNGFWVRTAARTRLENNVANANSQNGFLVESPTTTVTLNSASNNDGWGILAPSGAKDGGGNTASGNTLGQCSGVSCP